MFASPSFDASPPQPGGGSERSPYEEEDEADDDGDDDGQDSPIIFSSGDDDEEEEEEEEEDLDVDVEEEEEEPEDDEEEDDDDDEEEEEDDEEDDDSAAASPDTAASPASGGTRSAGTTTPAAPMPPPPAHNHLDGTNNNNNNSTHLTIRAVPEIKLGPKYREIGKEALCWQLSSAKPGNGVEQIRDGSTDTYWQSDGLKQPHWIQVHFARRVALSHVCLYLDYTLDESYTPKRVSVFHGMTSQDLQSAVYPAAREIEFAEPNGWCIIPLDCPPDPLDVYHEAAAPQSSGGIRAHLLRISILAMHQNGRDTHIRQVELYGPRRPNVPPALRPAAPTDSEEKENPALMDQDVTLPRWSMSSPAWGGGVVR